MNSKWLSRLHIRESHWHVHWHAIRSFSEEMTSETCIWVGEGQVNRANATIKLLMLEFGLKRPIK